MTRKVCLDNKKTALIVVDMINDYLDQQGLVPSLGCRKIIPNMTKLLKYCHNNDIKIIFCNTSLCCNNDLLAKRWGMHAARGSWGAETITELKPTERDMIVYKHTYDGFFETELNAVLKSIAIDTVIIAGIHTHVCVLFTAMGAYNNGYRVIVVEDCMTTPHQDNHDSRLRFFESHIGDLVKLDDIIN